MLGTVTRGIDCLRWKLSLTDLILLALALGIDCFVVSFSQGLIFKYARTKNSLRLAFTMGGFQGLMPVIGYVAADYMYKLVLPFSKLIVFGIFFILGAKFILEAFQTKKEEIQCIDFKCLLGLGVATSLDALVSGATLRLTGTNLVLAASLIGFASFVMSLSGFWTGNFIKKLPSKYLEITGGAILIALAAKVLL